MALSQAAARRAVRLEGQLNRYLHEHTRSAGGAILVVTTCFVVISAVALLLNHFGQVSTASIWLYLLFILLVTLRWGTAPGLLLALAANIVLLTFAIPPLGSPLAYDSRAYVRLGMAMVGMAVAVVTVAELNRRRLAADRRGRIEAETLADLGRRISASLDLAQVLRTAAEAAHRLVRADVTYITLVRAPRALEVAAAVGNRTSVFQDGIIPAVTGLSGKMLESGRPTRVQWAEEAGALGSPPPIVQAMAAEGIVSTLAVPVQQGSKTVGVFWVHARSRREFSDAEIALLERLAAHAAVAITNAYALAEEQQARSEVEALLAAAASLGAQAEPEAVLRTLLEQAAMLLKAERAIYAVPRDGLLVVPAYWLNGAWTEDAHTTRPHGILWTVWETGRSQRIDDMAASASPNGAVIRGYHRRTQLTVPILASEGPNLGVLALNNKQGDEGFTAHDQRLLEAICEAGAAVLIRANETANRLEAERSAAQRKREVEALLAAADQLNAALETDEVLRGVVEIAADLIGVRRAGIVTNEGDHAIRRCTLTDGVWRTDATRLPLDESIGGWVIQHGRPYRTDDFPGASLVYFPASEQGVPVSALSVPIVAPDGRVLGSLNLFERRDTLPFSDEDERLAEGIAHHAAVALERARLTTELRRMAAALESAAKFNQEVIAGASQGIVVYDRELRYVVFNPFMEGLTGLRAEQVLGKPALELFPHLRDNNVDELLQRALAGETVSTGDTPYTVPQTDRSGWVVSSFAPHRDATGAIIGVIGSVNEVTHRKVLETKLERQAFLDPLTQLPNRAFFMERLGQALNPLTSRGRAVAVLFLDLDGFKVVNDSLGHPVGDALLGAVGERLVACQRADDTIARFGGDEFAVLLQDVATPAAAGEVAERILHALKRPFSTPGHRSIFINASIGIAYREAPAQRCTAEDLIREADIALYHAKAAGKGRAVPFAPSMGVQAVERLELQTNLQRALRRSEFCLHYQPVVELQGRTTAGVEALLRWNHPQRGLLGPEAFIPLAEESGLILPIGRWVLEQACAQAVDWQRTGPLSVSVNLSARQFEQPNLVEQIASVLKGSGLAASALVLEITETAVIRDLEAAVATLAALKRLGVRLAIDDFGTGYSSLSYLELLRVDILKIDRSFMQRLERSSATKAIVQATIAMAHALGMVVTAEGIETADQLSTLVALGCDLGQGYYLREPGPPSELDDFLAERDEVSAKPASLRAG